MCRDECKDTTSINNIFQAKFFKVIKVARASLLSAMNNFQHFTHFTAVSLSLPLIIEVYLGLNHKSIMAL